MIISILKRLLSIKLFLKIHYYFIGCFCFYFSQSCQENVSIKVVAGLDEPDECCFGAAREGKAEREEWLVLLLGKP